MKNLLLCVLGMVFFIGIGCLLAGFFYVVHTDQTVEAPASRSKLLNSLTGDLTMGSGTRGSGTGSIIDFRPNADWPPAGVIVSCRWNNHDREIRLNWPCDAGKVDPPGH